MGMGRFERQIPIIGQEGQKALSDATVGIVGLGGLGVNVVTALASAGIGHLVLVDGDIPSDTNLNRQYLYSELARRPKASQAAEWVKKLQPGADVVPFDVFLSDSNASFALDGCDILVDCLDSFSARMCLNRYAVGAGKVLVHAGVEGLNGQVTVVRPGRTPCLHCLFGERRETGTKSSLGSVAMTVGGMEATEVVKILTGCGTPLWGTMMTIDFCNGSMDTMAIKRDPQCPVCGHL
jgi:molybdopterin-synthase adenylyltransferase